MVQDDLDAGTRPDRCGWCALQRGVYRDPNHGRVCRRCYAYRAKYDVLPPSCVIAKRVDRLIHTTRSTP